MSESIKWYWLTLAVITAGLIYLLRPVLTPFLVAGLLAYMANPIVNWLARFKIPRTISVIVLFILFICGLLFAVLLFIPMLIDQIRWFVAKVPNMTTWLQTVVIPKINQTFEVEIHLNLESFKQMILGHWQQASDLLASVLLTISTSGATLLAWMINLILIPLVTFYLLRDWPRLWNRGRELLPRHVESTVVSLVQECNLVLGSFFRGQLLVITVLSIYYTLALYTMKLNVALLIGLLSGIFSFIPIIGLLLGIVSASLAAFFQFNDLWHLGMIFFVYLVGHLLENMILTPLIVGDKIGLHPVAVIFAILAGGQLFGFVGILLALPTAAVIVVLMRYSKKQYQSSPMYRREHGSSL